MTQDLLYRPPIERKLSDEQSSNRLDTILADRNSDCHQPHDFALLGDPGKYAASQACGLMSLSLRQRQNRAARPGRYSVEFRCGGGPHGGAARTRGAGRASWLRYCNVTFSSGRISQMGGPHGGAPRDPTAGGRHGGGAPHFARVDRIAAAGLTEPRCASERGLAMGGGRPTERRFTVRGSGKFVARYHRTVLVLACWKFESISLQRRESILYAKYRFRPSPDTSASRRWDHLRRLSRQSLIPRL